MKPDEALNASLQRLIPIQRLSDSDARRNIAHTRLVVTVHRLKREGTAMSRGKSFVLNLVLIVVIVVAAALFLFPIFARTHGHARSHSCQSNLKQCAQALKIYCDDYNGMLPSSCLVSHSKQWNRRDFLTFATRIGRLRSDPKMRQSTWQLMRKQTWPQVVLPGWDIMVCPSDPVDRTNPNAQASYWYKTANDKAWYGIGCGAPRRHIGDYAYESDQIAFYEHLGWHFNDTTGLHNGVRINVSFMDTHVKTILLKNATSGDLINCAANSDGEPMYYDCAVDPKTGYPKTQTGPAKLTDPARCYDKL